MADIIGRETKVLDKGFVRVVDTMGDDSAVVQAARTSYGKGTKSYSSDRGLIRYLMRHDHGTPLEMCEIKLHVKVPNDTWKQWLRHRMSSTNEYSTRYSEAITDKQQTHMGEWRVQSKNNKQGSAGFLPEDIGALLTLDELELHVHADEVYRKRLAAGVAKEQARKDLVFCNYTEAYWKIDVRNLLNFLRLRMHSHAQLEIRQYANAIGEFVKEWMPITWEAFEDYILYGVKLSKQELDVLQMFAPKKTDIVESSLFKKLSKREQKEFLEKLGL